MLLYFFDFVLASESVYYFMLFLRVEADNNLSILFLHSEVSIILCYIRLLI
jgi:hypothetical protein